MPSLYRFAARLLAALIGFTGAAFGADDPFGKEATQLTEAQLVAHASTVFARVDQDRDGWLDAEEFAAERMISAQLARLSRRVPIDGDETVHLIVPKEVPSSMERGERLTLTNIARNEHAARSAGAPGLDEAAFASILIEEFLNADRDFDGILQAEELMVFARLMAGDLAVSFTAS
ncbi:MAG: hypothetical protein AAGI89_11000 [Pseudomonadota bacterium]